MPDPTRSDPRPRSSVDALLAKVPATFEIHLSVAVSPGEDGMSDMWDTLHHALDGIPGVFSEGGMSSLMEPGQLVADSPLDLYIRDYRRAEA